MAYDAAIPVNAPSGLALPQTFSAETVRKDFRRIERLVLLLGASAFGSVIGFGAALAMGRVDVWLVVLSAAPFLVLALHLTSQTLRDGFERRAIGCSIASVMHAAALLAWPLTSLFTPLGQLNFFIAPTLALATLILFASCWSGPSRAVYRVAAQGALVAALAAQQGVMVLLG
ncbi:MAG: hypothetical protein AB7O98_05040 [Hyphomonadaceae bacterium]